MLLARCCAAIAQALGNSGGPHPAAQPTSPRHKGAAHTMSQLAPCGSGGSAAGEPAAKATVWPMSDPHAAGALAAARGSKDGPPHSQHDTGTSDTVTSVGGVGGVPSTPGRVAADLGERTSAAVRSLFSRVTFSRRSTEAPSRV